LQNSTVLLHTPSPHLYYFCYAPTQERQQQFLVSEQTKQRQLIYNLYKTPYRSIFGWELDQAYHLDSIKSHCSSTLVFDRTLSYQMIAFIRSRKQFGVTMNDLTRYFNFSLSQTKRFLTLIKEHITLNDTQHYIAVEYSTNQSTPISQSFTQNDSNVTKEQQYINKKKKQEQEYAQQQESQKHIQQPSEIAIDDIDINLLTYAECYSLYLRYYETYISNFEKNGTYDPNIYNILQLIIHRIEDLIPSMTPEEKAHYDKTQQTNDNTSNPGTNAIIS
jgi:hypothetical protein